MKYLIGIDGGGTHSRLLAVDLGGNQIGFSTGKSTNVESNPISVVKQNFTMLIRDFLQTYQRSMDDCAGLCFGTAGVDTESSRLMIETMLDSLNLTCPIKVVNDAVIALYADTQGQPGLMLISGTGSIGYGINEEKRTWRVGGFGYIVGDEASAYWVAKKGISAALKAYDHSGPDTSMVNDFCKYLGLKEFDEIVDYVYQKNKSDLARLNYVVVNAHAKKDEMATRIMEEALFWLCRMVDTLVEELSIGDKPYPLLLGGGFLLGNKWMKKSVQERVAERHPSLRIASLKTRAEWGAVYMAADLAGVKLPARPVCEPNGPAEAQEGASPFVAL